MIFKVILFLLCTQHISANSLKRLNKIENEAKLNKLLKLEKEAKEACEKNTSITRQDILSNSPKSLEKLNNYVKVSKEIDEAYEKFRNCIEESLFEYIENLFSKSTQEFKSKLDAELNKLEEKHIKEAVQTKALQTKAFQKEKLQKNCDITININYDDNISNHKQMKLKHNKEKNKLLIKQLTELYKKTSKIIMQEKIELKMQQANEARKAGIYVDISINYNENQALKAKHEQERITLKNEFFQDFYNTNQLSEISKLINKENLDLAIKIHDFIKENNSTNFNKKLFFQIVEFYMDLKYIEKKYRENENNYPNIKETFFYKSLNDEKKAEIKSIDFLIYEFIKNTFLEDGNSYYKDKLMKKLKNKAIENAYEALNENCNIDLNIKYMIYINGRRDIKDLISATSNKIMKKKHEEEIKKLQEEQLKEAEAKNIKYKKYNVDFYKKGKEAIYEHIKLRIQQAKEANEAGLEVRIKDIKYKEAIYYKYDYTRVIYDYANEDATKKLQEKHQKQIKELQEKQAQYTNKEYEKEIFQLKLNQIEEAAGAFTILNFKSGSDIFDINIFLLFDITYIDYDNNKNLEEKHKQERNKLILAQIQKLKIDFYENIEYKKEDQELKKMHYKQFIELELRQVKEANEENIFTDISINYKNKQMEEKYEAIIKTEEQKFYEFYWNINQLSKIKDKINKAQCSKEEKEKYQKNLELAIKIHNFYFKQSYASHSLFYYSSPDPLFYELAQYFMDFAEKNEINFKETSFYKRFYSFYFHEKFEAAMNIVKTMNKKDKELINNTTK